VFVHLSQDVIPALANICRPGGTTAARTTARIAGTTRIALRWAGSSSPGRREGAPPRRTDSVSRRVPGFCLAWAGWALSIRPTTPYLESWEDQPRRHAGNAKVSGLLGWFWPTPRGRPRAGQIGRLWQRCSSCGNRAKARSGEYRPGSSGRDVQTPRSPRALNNVFQGRGRHVRRGQTGREATIQFRPCGPFLNRPRRGGRSPSRGDAAALLGLLLGTWQAHPPGWTNGRGRASPRPGVRRAWRDIYYTQSRPFPRSWMAGDSGALSTSRRSFVRSRRRPFRPRVVALRRSWRRGRSVVPRPGRAVVGPAR